MAYIEKYSIYFIGFFLVFIFVGSFLFWKDLGISPGWSGAKIEIVEKNENSAVGGGIKNEIEEKSLEQDANKLDLVEDYENKNLENEEKAVVEEDMIANPDFFIPPASNLEKNPQKLKIGFITDIHARSNSIESGERVLKTFFQEGIKYFLEKMNNEFAPNFILINGDVIEGTGRNSTVGKEELSLVRDIFEKTLIPKYWVIGNHDLRSVDKEKWQEALQVDYLKKSFEVGNYQIIIIDSNFDNKEKDVRPDVYYTRGHVSRQEISWLEEELENTDRRKIVFMHHPPLWNIEPKSNDRLPDNSLELQGLFARNGVLAVFAGHTEDLYIEKKDGVKYFVLPGFIKNDKYKKTFSAITIEGEDIVVDMSYLSKSNKYKTIRITD